jgi:hypothetical protein
MPAAAYAAVCSWRFSNQYVTDYSMPNSTTAGLLTLFPQKGYPGIRQYVPAQSGPS